MDSGAELAPLDLLDPGLGLLDAAVILLLIVLIVLMDANIVLRVLIALIVLLLLGRPGRARRGRRRQRRRRRAGPRRGFRPRPPRAQGRGDGARLRAFELVF